MSETKRKERERNVHIEWEREKKKESWETRPGFGGEMKKAVIRAEREKSR